MELIVDFEKLESIVRATTDPFLRLERELAIRDLRKMHVVVPKNRGTQDSLATTLDEMHATVAETAEKMKRVENMFAKGNAPRANAGFGGRSGVAHGNESQSQDRIANEISGPHTKTIPPEDLKATNTIEPTAAGGAIFQQQPGETFLEAMARARRVTQGTQIQNTQGEWTPVNPRGGYVEEMRPPDEAADIAKALEPPPEVNDEMDRLNLVRINGTGGSLKCRRCGHEIIAMRFGPGPLARGRAHAEIHRTTDGMDFRSRN